MSAGISRNHGPATTARCITVAPELTGRGRSPISAQLADGSFLRDATMSMPSTELAPVPIVDLSEGGPVRRAGEARERARGLRDACVNWLPRPAAALLPALDSATRRWLKRSCSPYTEDVAAIAATLGFPGIWFLNGCYQWGCTSLACDEGGVPWL